MEVAGVVLGAVPIILIMLDSYSKACDIAKDAWEWSATIDKIRKDIFMQTEQLRNTLQSAGIVWNDGQALRVAVLEEALKHHGHDKCRMFVSIIRDMDAILNDVARDLDPDGRGPVSVDFSDDISPTDVPAAKLVRSGVVARTMGMAKSPTQLQKETEKGDYRRARQVEPSLAQLWVGKYGNADRAGAATSRSGSAKA